MSSSLISTATLAQIVDADGVVEWDSLDRDFRQRISRSLLPDNTPSHAIYPSTVEQLSAAIAFAHENNYKLLLCGAGSKLSWGNAVGSVQLVVSTARLNRLIEHAEGDLTVTVEAGMRFADLQAILAKSGQFLAIDPAYADRATIGGIVAAGDTGSLRHRYNSVRDMCIGVSFVRSDGELVKAGGRVVKNVAGYDMMKLLTGSYGTLGAIAQVTFRLYPLAAASATMLLTGDMDAIARARTEIPMSSLTPSAVDLLSDRIVSSLDSGLGNGLGLAVRFDSIAQSVTQQCDRLAELAKTLNLKATKIEDSKRFWPQLRNLIWQVSDRDRTVICKVGILGSEACSVLRSLSGISPDLSACAQVHAGSGLGVLRCDFRAEASIADRVHQILKIRTLAEKTDGFLSVLEAPNELKQEMDVWGYTGNALHVMQALQQKFDPQGILNPGRL
ncbi:FAD-binding oxidoreductase [Pseudanabaena sp. PCC 6802]|uniref:FAD-binding oxidoreductase n=1 Tax=Pseudanabaena sp. PCC 6802 TaxID=118173 RepID=UPI00034657B6|nr:FAD-binding oxidoreductase [Pseudanabaena sp. PCC 6802]